MPLWSPEQAREMAKKGANIRWARERARKIVLHSSAIPGSNGSAGQQETGFLPLLHSRVRTQIYGVLDLIDAEAAKRSCDGQRLDRLAAALERLAEIERVLDGRPLPGSRRPERDDSSRPHMQTKPAFTHLGPARPAVPRPVTLVTPEAPTRAEEPKRTLTERPDDWE